MLLLSRFLIVILFITYNFSTINSTIALKGQHHAFAAILFSATLVNVACVIIIIVKYNQVSELTIVITITAAAFIIIFQHKNYSPRVVGEREFGDSVGEVVGWIVEGAENKKQSGQRSEIKETTARPWDSKTLPNRLKYILTISKKKKILSSLCIRRSLPEVGQTVGQTGG